MERFYDWDVIIIIEIIRRIREIGNENDGNIDYENYEKVYMIIFMVII